jgi:hypothetical protein
MTARSAIRQFGNVVRNLWCATKQLWFPREFRIRASPWPAELEKILVRLEQSRRASSEVASQEPKDSDVGRRQGDTNGLNNSVALDEQKVRDIGTYLWRLRQKMVKPGTNQPLDGLQKTFYHLESLWDVFAQVGLDIQDHTNQPFDPGMAIKVVCYQPMSELDRERVIETIKPTLYLQGKQIQMGEVIVGRPEQNRTQRSEGQPNDTNNH